MNQPHIWRIDRIPITNTNDSWLNLVNTLGQAEIDGWTIEGLEFVHGKYDISKAVIVMTKPREDKEDYE